MTFVATCPKVWCLAPTIVPMSLENVGFSNNGGGNFVLACWRCGDDFDATGGGDGEFSVVKGRLARVVAAARSFRDAMRQVDREEIVGLRDALTDAREEGLEGAEVLHRLAVFPRWEEWAKRNPAFAEALVTLGVGVLIYVLTILVGSDEPPAPVVSPAPEVNVTVVVDQPSDAEIEKVVRSVIEKAEAKPPPAGKPVTK